MIKNKGFTLIETVVVMGILAIISLVGVESIVEFQKNSVLDGSANEFASSLRAARTKSLSGELLLGEKPEDFASDGLPKYGVRISGVTYSLFREYRLISDVGPVTQVLETQTVDNQLSVKPDGAFVLFKRVDGSHPPISFTVERKDGRGSRTIDAGSKGIVLSK